MKCVYLLLILILNHKQMYSKYLHCMLLYFSENNLSKLLDKIEIILNDSMNFYYNFVQYDEDLRVKKLFDRLLDLYIEENNNQVYWCIWTLIHVIPLFMKPDNSFIEHFYKTVIINKIECINCIMHYITFISELTNEQWKDPEFLFDFMVNLHNEINENLEKEIKDLSLMKNHYESIKETILSQRIFKEIHIEHDLGNIMRVVPKDYQSIINDNILINESCSIYYFDKTEKKLLAKFYKNVLNTQSLKNELTEYLKNDNHIEYTYKVDHTNISSKVYDDIISYFKEVNINYERKELYHMFYNTNTNPHEDSLYEEYGSVFVLKHKDISGLFVFNHFDIYFDMEENDLLIFDKSKYHYNVCNDTLTREKYRLALNFT